MIITLLIVGLVPGMLWSQNDNLLFGLVWKGGNGADDYKRGWPVKAGFDLDQDGKSEIVAWDQETSTAFLWESNGNGDNQYNIIWKVTYTGLLNSNRSIMVGDLDMDGRKELYVVLNEPNGTDAMKIYEWDGTDNGIPLEPSYTWDPPRNSASIIDLEYESEILNLDEDPNDEIVLTYRGRGGLYLAIMELSNVDFENPQWFVEFEERNLGSERFHGIGFGDINNDTYMDIITVSDGSKQPIHIYSNSEEDAYDPIATWTSANFPLRYSGSASSIVVTDINKDGEQEIYLFSRNGIVWVVTGVGADLSSPPTLSQFHEIYQSPLRFGITTAEHREAAFGDLDQDGLPDFYFTTRETEAVEDLEYIGGVGGDVTDPDNYFGFTIFEDSPTNGISLPTAGLWFGDIDGDGPLHMDLVFTAREADTRRSGIFVIEYDPTTTDIEVLDTGQSPSDYALKQNYPNPFNPETTIEYSLPASGRVTLNIHTILGQKVRTLVNDHQATGVYKVRWDGKDDLGRNLASGVYVYRIQTGNFVQSRKLVLLR